jgi:hypothetical protein
MSLFSDDFLDGAQAGQWEPVKNNFKYYSGAQEWAMLKPGKSEVLAFLDEISKSIKADSSYYLYTFMPSLKIQRAQAITDIYNWVDLKTDNKSFFPGIDINVFRVTIQLAMRVFWPDTINQGHCGFCGPTTVLFDFAKRYPVKYAKCCMDLVDKGTGRIQLNDGQLGFDISLKNNEGGDWKNKRMPEADFIMLRAVRHKAKALIPASQSGGMDFAFDRDPTHATTPTQIKLLLDKAGYSDANDFTIAWPGQGGTGPTGSLAKQSNLDKCMILSRGTLPRPAIILLIAVELADRALNPSFVDKSGRWDKATQLHELHWIVIEKLRYSGKNVTGRLVTWTASKDFSFGRDEFLNLYHGFVYARP